jgi:replicative superfamily II helicase
VEAREFLEPCKVIASFQIARDLRNDAAVQLSSRLSAIPEEVKEFCRDAETSGSTPEISEEQASKFAAMLGDDILDTDMDEALENCKTFMSIVEQQQQARKQLIHLLIQSRCQFGSDEAAEASYSLDAVLEKIKERKQLLADAMDLEGLDFEEDGANAADGAEIALEPLTWYKSGEPDAKRARTE